MVRLKLLVLFSGLLAWSASSLAQTAVTTYHYDNYRTGWNHTETVLTPANVKPGSFTLLRTVQLDDQVDAQPLYVPGVVITAGSYKGIHDTIYIVTENNSVYAIDLHSRKILLKASFGPPIVYPLGCGNNAPDVGITSTPAIDVAAGTIYVMAYTRDAKNNPTYQLHALDLGSLADKMAPRTVAATHTLTDGSTFTFNATYQRQRPALLLANGNLYAGFGSFCDLSANLSRGWLLGWTASNLQPFPSNQVFDTQATSPDSFFLSSIWMSGYGPAADDSGNVLFVTGNSDYSGTTYDGITNIQESVVKVSPTLNSVEDLFTPSNQAGLDQSDADFGSGGLLVLPDQPGAIPHVAVAAGKDGNMYVMNEDHLGGYSPTRNNVLGTYSVGGCWCGQSYFVDADGKSAVVSSGGTVAEVWKIQTSPKFLLTMTAASPSMPDVQDPGFFTAISSNGTSNPIIWAVSRPISKNPATLRLYAFDPDSGTNPMKVLFRNLAGYWPNLGGNSNLVPVVADGHVLVAANKQLRVFGLVGAAAKKK